MFQYVKGQLNEIVETIDMYRPVQNSALICANKAVQDISVEPHVACKSNPVGSLERYRYSLSSKSIDMVFSRPLNKKIIQTPPTGMADTTAVLESLLELIPQELADGNIVELGAFGSFRLTINAEGSATPEEVSSRNIKKVNSRFMPGKEFKQVIDITKFKKTAG